MSISILCIWVLPDYLTATLNIFLLIVSITALVSFKKTEFQKSVSDYTCGQCFHPRSPHKENRIEYFVGGDFTGWCFAQSIFIQWQEQRTHLITLLHATIGKVQFCNEFSVRLFLKFFLAEVTQNV